MSDQPIVELTRSLERLIAKLDKREDCPLTPAELERIKRAGDMVEWLDTTGKIGKWVLGLLTGAVLIVSQWQRIAGFFSGGQS